LLHLLSTTFAFPEETAVLAKQQCKGAITLGSEKVQLLYHNKYQNSVCNLIWKWRIIQMYNDDITVNLTFYHCESIGHLQSLIV